MKIFLRSTTFLAIIACWLWSTAFASVKIGLQYQPPFQFAGLRFIIAGILIFIWYGKPRKYFRDVKMNLGFIMIIASFQTFLQYAFFYKGMSLVPGALGAMLVGASPLFIAIVAHFFSHNDKITFTKSISIMVGVAGLALITLGRSTIQLKGKFEWLGIILLIINNFLSGYANVLVKKSHSPISPYVLSSSSLMIGGVFLLILSSFTEKFHSGPYPWKYYVALGWLSFISASALSIWYALLKRPGVKVSGLNTWKFLIPVSGAMLSWILIAGEKPDLISVAGVFVIAGSLLILGYNNRKSKEMLL